MNFITFSEATTNIFPIANSHSGGQLVTEFNMRARETVGTDPKITYSVGPSYTHGEADFEVTILVDAGGAFVNPYTLQIAPGRAVINGHYVENLVPMTIDLVEANASLQAQARPELKGDLAIGIRTFYSTEETVAGSILTEDENNMYIGVQLVILPEDEFITPYYSPEDPNKVTADLKLATFTFLNNTITALKNVSTKMQYINSSRLYGFDEVASSKYVTKNGLNPKRIYAFAGKANSPGEGPDTWEDVTDSLMIWDADPIRTSEKPALREAQFISTEDKSYLALPHKQITGMTDEDGHYEYYEPKILTIPTADYNANTSGMVNKAYTKQIKDISTRVDTFRSTLTGKQIYFMDTRFVNDELPPISTAWDIGDYILVKNDEHYTDGDADATIGAPSTKYVVLPGQVLTIKYIGQSEGTEFDPAPILDNITGVQLAYLEWYEESGQDAPDTRSPEYYPVFFDPSDTMRGVPYDADSENWVDYFRLRWYQTPTVEEHPYIDYYFGVETAGPHQWSDAILITGSIALADEDTIGGFYNVAEEALDQGYVRVDDTGHLVLLDYELLRSGTLAYAIHSDITIPTATDIDSLQAYLDEYVNDRIAFPVAQNTSDVPSIIHIYMDIPESTEEGGVINIHGIDSRFNTAVCLHIQGDKTLNNVTVNIFDCQKFMIDNEIEGTPVVNVIRTCLYYDPIIFNYIKLCARDTSVYGNFTGFRDLSIWYAQKSSEDPALVVDGMKVGQLDSAIISSEIDYWKEMGTAVNDNNYMVALKSITFSGTGDIVGVEILGANNSTDNIEQGEKIIVGEIELPQGSALTYPMACLTKPLKVTGTFTSAYCSDDHWYVTNNSMTLLTGTFNPYDMEESMKGTVAFHSSTVVIPSTISQTSIEPWEADTFNVFSGGAIS